MKISVVPAQITTVEDRIAGNLNFTQILLLSAPQFITAVVFLVIPPIGHFSIAKLILSLIVTSSSASLAIRIKDKILLDLIKIRLLYFIRPHIFSYEKLIEDNSFEYKIETYQPSPSSYRKNVHPQLNKTAKSLSYKLLTSSDYSVLFKTKSGGLNVEIKAQE
jgi:hypothetical protein